MEDNTACECAGDSLYALFLRCSNIISRRIGGNASRRRIIALLDEHGALTQRDLRVMLGIQAGSLSELVTRMERFGVIERESDSRDKRRVVIRLTEEGRKRAAEPRTIGDDRLFAALTGQEQEQLRSMLMKIEEAHIRWRRENP